MAICRRAAWPAGAMVQRGDAPEKWAASRLAEIAFPRQHDTWRAAPPKPRPGRAEITAQIQRRAKTTATRRFEPRLRLFQTPFRLRRAELAARLTGVRRAVAQAFGSRRPTLSIGPSAECGSGSLMASLFSLCILLPHGAGDSKFIGKIHGLVRSKTVDFFKLFRRRPQESRLTTSRSVVGDPFGQSGQAAYTIHCPASQGQHTRALTGPFADPFTRIPTHILTGADTMTNFAKCSTPKSPADGNFA